MSVAVRRAMELDRQCYLARMEVQVEDLRCRVADLLGREPSEESGALARVRVEIQHELQLLEDAFGRARSADDASWESARNGLNACCARARVDVADLERRARERVLRACRVESTS